MATDIDVQFFSHLNRLTLSNNWGDLIRLLDTCLVNGLPLTSVTSATIDAQGDITLNLYAAHNCLLLQIVELSGFAPTEINGKYRIKGMPTSTQLILKAEHVGKNITTTGAAKLASLGYDIIFRDIGDIKRAYRAKNPLAEHPFIRVDESLSGEGGGAYAASYAKYAMVGLLENMAHIDDYADTSKLQLPLDTTDFLKNWKITGTSTAVKRGWSRWYWNRSSPDMTSATNDTASQDRTTQFTLVGDADAFYFHRNLGSNTIQSCILSGCGIFYSSLASNIIPPWFLMSIISNNSASQNAGLSNNLGGITGAQPMTGPSYPACNYFFIPKYDTSKRISNNNTAIGVTPDFYSGNTSFADASNLPSMEIPVLDNDRYLRGTLKHILYSAKNQSITTTAPVIADNSMYVGDNVITHQSNVGGFLYYLGELE